MSIRLFFLLMPIALLSACNSADEPVAMSTESTSVDAEAQAQELFESLESDFADGREELAELLKAASGNEEEQEVLRNYNSKFGVWPERSIAIYEKYPETNFGFKALEWTFLKSDGELYEKSIDLLLKNHIDREQLKSLPLRMIGRKVGKHVENNLNRLMMESPHDSVKGVATLALGKYMVRVREYKKNLTEPTKPEYKEVYDYIISCNFEDDEIEGLYQTVNDKYGDISIRHPLKTLGAMAKGEMSEFKYLAIGRVAPDIEGDDLKGQPFKLSDYRGKVVVIDFWGDW